MSTLDEQFNRLSEFRAGHRARSVVIEHDNRYGASCWLIKLRHEKGGTQAYETRFLTRDGDDAGYVEACKKLGTVFVPRDPDDDEWPGLAATLKTALDAFEAGISCDDDP